VFIKFCGDWKWPRSDFGGDTAIWLLFRIRYEIISCNCFLTLTNFSCVSAGLPWIWISIIHGYIHGYIYVWISDLSHPVNISIDIMLAHLLIKFNTYMLSVCIIFSVCRSYAPAYTCRRAWMQPAPWKKSQLLLGWGDRTAYPKASVRLPVVERKRFSTVTAVPYTLWWRCYIQR